MPGPMVHGEPVLDVNTPVSASEVVLTTFVKGMVPPVVLPSVKALTVPSSRTSGGLYMCVLLSRAMSFAGQRREVPQRPQGGKK
jgi:hypothetical protein